MQHHRPGVRARFTDPEALVKPPAAAAWRADLAAAAEIFGPDAPVDPHPAAAP